MVLEGPHDHRVDGRDRVGVLDEITQVGVLLLTDGGFQRDGLLGDLVDLSDFGDRHFHPASDFLDGRLATELLHQHAGGSGQLVDGFDHVHRNPDGPRLVCDGTSDRLTDPPRGVGRELVASAVLELIHRLHQTDVAFLDEVEELETAISVLFGDGDHEPEIGDDKFLFGLIGIGLTSAHLGQENLEIVIRSFEPALELFEFK